MSSLIRRLRTLAPSREQLEAHPWLGRLAPQLADPKVWLWSRRGVATGVAAGLFIGLLIPVAQILLAALAAIVLRANVPVAAFATLVTNPLTVAPIYYAAYRLGAWMTGVSAPVGASLTDLATLRDNLGTIGLPLFAGLAVAAVVVALVAYLLISQAWSWQVAARRRRARA